MFHICLQLGLTAIIAYLIGSIPTGYLIVKAKTGKDIRTVGSGSTGATNVKRVLGKNYFFLVMLLDAIKGALPVILAKMFVTVALSIGLAPVIAAVAVIIGHSKSIFLQFKGGKSVASGVGTIIALLISPFVMYFLNAPAAYAGYCAIGALYIVYLHRENIKRLIQGNENKVR